MVAPSVVTLASSTGQGEKVDRGSILGGAIRRPVKRSVSEGSKTDRENSGREGERLRPSPAILLEVNPCTFPQQLNGFAKGEGSGEKMDSKLQVPQMVKKKGKGIRSGTKKVRTRDEVAKSKAARSASNSGTPLSGSSAIQAQEDR